MAQLKDLPDLNRLLPLVSGVSSDLELGVLTPERCRFLLKGHNFLKKGGISVKNS